MVISSNNLPAHASGDSSAASNTDEESSGDKSDPSRKEDLQGFRAALNARGYTLDEHETKAIFEHADFNENGALDSSNEFNEAMSRAKVAQEEKSSSSPDSDDATAEPNAKSEVQPRAADASLQPAINTVVGNIFKPDNNAPINVKPGSNNSATVTTDTVNLNSLGAPAINGEPETIAYADCVAHLGYKPTTLTIDGNIDVTGIPTGTQVIRTNAQNAVSDENRLDNNTLGNRDTGYTTDVDPSTKTVKTTVKVYLDPNEDVPQALLNKRKQQWQQEVNHTYDTKHSGMTMEDENGEQWNMDVNLEYVDSPEEADRVVTISNDPEQRPNTETWSLHQGAGVAAHEVGHYLGPGDHYQLVTEIDGSHTVIVEEGYEDDIMGHYRRSGSRVKEEGMSGVADAASLSTGHKFKPAMKKGETEFDTQAVGGSGGTAFNGSAGPRGDLNTVRLGQDQDGNFTGLSWDGRTIENKPITQTNGTFSDDVEPIELKLRGGEEITEMQVGTSDDGNEVIWVLLTTSDGRTIEAGRKEQVDDANISTATAAQGDSISGFHGRAGSSIDSLGATWGFDSPMFGVDNIYADDPSYNHEKYNSDLYNY